MSQIFPPSPKPPSTATNDESSLDDYEEALLDLGDEDVEYSHHLQPAHYNDNEQCMSSVTPADWEEAESFMANSESFPISTPASSSGTSPLPGLSSHGVSPSINNANEQAFPYSIPEDPDQSLSSISDVLQVEKDFMEFVRSFPHNVATVPSVPQPSAVPMTKKSQGDSNAKVGLDHLDNLCKLMEQLSDLKETNVKLRRRIQYLEDIKTLQEIHKEMADDRKLCSSGLSEDEIQQLKNKSRDSEESEQSKDSNVGNEDTLEVPSSEHLLGLYRSKTANQINERGHKSRSAAINKERRERSKSVGHPSQSVKGKKRPSRWSKVKEVLGIEKNEELSANGSDGAPNAEPVEETCDRDKDKNNRKISEHSKSYKLSGSKSHSSVLSSRSFSEAERQNALTVLPIKKSGTLDSKTAQAAMESFEKEELAKKSPKTPWGKMKTMIQIRRDNRQQKSESSSSSPRDVKPNKSPILTTEPATSGHSPNRRNQRGNHRSPYTEGGIDSAVGNNSFRGNEKNLQRLDIGYSNEHRYRQKSPHKHNSRKSSVPQTESESKAMYEKSSPKNRPRDLENYVGMQEAAISKENCKRKKSKPRPPPLKYPDDSVPHVDHEQDDPAMSPTAQRKWVWTKVKDVLKGSKREEDSHFSLSAPSSPASAAEALTFDFDLEKAKEEEAFNSTYQSPRVSDGGANPILLTNSSPSATVTELLRELQQNLSDDFNKKLEEWQRCRTEGIQKVVGGPEVERKDSFGRMRKISKPEKKLSTSEKLTKSSYHMPKKDLCWLEKEQQKVDREIIRLSKEKQKFEKRSFRLKQLKEAMTDGDGQKKEVLVKTSAGEFRFEGISDAFTKKLYEWETKKGVNPELSTIALLDESLKPAAETVLAAVGSNSTRTSPEQLKACFQVSRASSEPDLSTAQKDTNPSNQATRSKSGDTLLAGELDVVNLEPDIPLNTQQEHRDGTHHTEDSYYSLLEENMFLLDQLKDKEEICSHLQNELERLDDKTEKTNRTHQEEMEKYRQKLWEIHMSRPRDLQGSLHLISELKSRIEELQKCSDKLKSDRERLEESFRYHSSQQARLADDLIRKMREIQVTGTSYGFSRGGSRRKWRKTLKCDPSSISRIHELSTQILQQARDVEQTLMERTRQVCHLRWELLHRDMSAVLLQAALHRVTSQGEPVTILPTWDKRRNKFKNIKAWSVDTTTRRPSEDLVTDDWLQERLKQLTMAPYNDWANINFSANDLMTTAHELKKETMRLAISRQDGVSDSEEKKSANWSADSEMADSDRYYDTGSAVNSRSSSFSSGPGGLRGSHSDTRLYERSRSLRRNSSSSMSCVEASDSSSLHDSDKMHYLLKKFPWKTQWRSMDNVSSSYSSRSSILEEETGKSLWRPVRSSSRGAEALPQEELTHAQLQQKYGSFKETDEENEEPKVSSDWGSQCLITPRPIHLARISDNESDKDVYSPQSHSSQNADSIIGSMKYYPAETISTSSYPGGKSYLMQEKAFNLPQECKADVLIHGDEQTYFNTTDGSMESLDKYETAIRDEELTISDDQNEQEYYEHRTSGSGGTFSYCEDPVQRTSNQIHSISSVGSSSFSHNCATNYCEENKHRSHASSYSSLQEHGNTSMPGSPNISQFKYKGTKGFGRSPRLGYKREEEKLSSFTNIDENGADDLEFGS
ncbi:hypothetical protein HNY73_000689 [Argiope bruennichi]|uniref:Uncharacterized protein n=1 Tax=Argiope bruennichi TaxID=94029 RepID=A0A8T0FZ36_ARGBR|nr:hypothetical protein HNY73_000689 [Argiope bruennichi]